MSEVDSSSEPPPPYESRAVRAARSVLNYLYWYMIILACHYLAFAILAVKVKPYNQQHRTALAMFGFSCILHLVGAPIGLAGHSNEHRVAMGVAWGMNALWLFLVVIYIMTFTFQWCKYKSWNQATPLR